MVSVLIIISLSNGSSRCKRCARVKRLIGFSPNWRQPPVYSDEILYTEKTGDIWLLHRDGSCPCICV